MKKDWFEDERLDRYLVGKATAAQQAELEALANQDASLREALSLGQDLRLAFKAAGREEMRQKIKRWEKVRPLDTGPSRRWRWPGAISVAAALALVIWLAWPRPASPEELLAAHFEPYPNVLSGQTRAAQPQPQTSLEAAMAAYEVGDYALSQQQLTQWQAAHPDSLPELTFYQANAALAQGNAAQAEALFMAVRSTGSRFAPAATWYQALAQLAQGRNESARDLFLEISREPMHPFQRQAAALLEKM
jgi:hypothetical protein